MFGGLTKLSSGCLSFQLPGIVLVPWRCLAAIVTHQTPTCSSLMLRGSGRWLQFKFWQSVCLMCFTLNNLSCMAHYLFMPTGVLALYLFSLCVMWPSLCVCMLWVCQWSFYYNFFIICIVSKRMSVWVCPSTSHPVTPLNISIHIPRKPLYLQRQRSSVCFFTTQLSKSPLRPPEPAVPQRPSPRPSGPGGTQPHQSTQQQPQWRQVAMSPSPLKLLSKHTDTKQKAITIG